MICVTGLLVNLKRLGYWGELVSRQLHPRHMLFNMIKRNKIGKEEVSHPIIGQNNRVSFLAIQRGKTKDGHDCCLNRNHWRLQFPAYGRQLDMDYQHHM